jgi:hypothetical protein
MVRRNMYLLTTKEHIDYDSYNAHVVIAKNEDEARSLCPHGDEGDIWNIYREHSSCIKIGTSLLESQHILGSFNAG